MMDFEKTVLLLFSFFLKCFNDVTNTLYIV